MKVLHKSILGVNVNILNMDTTIAQFDEWRNVQSKVYICVAPAHSIMECVNDPALLPIFNEADLVTPDGMAIVWLLQLKGYKETRRVYGPDLLMAACQHGANKNWKHFFYGGEPGVARNLSDKLQHQIPNLQITGTCSPPFGRPTSIEENALLNMLNQSGADFLWVGMSSPWQEIWMHENRDRIRIPVMVGVGAAFDFLSGSKKQAPKWIQRIGMEWLYRLIKEPKRLWPRYKQYPRFVWLSLKELLSESQLTNDQKCHR
ncbi:MAG: glycosyltransferase [Chloroflexi bacterium HGW-Chloroflexi-4]|jgi:N-acetylglucosaminyldiphosphoundecaprenol N-acetyl-beta-D-mannosaminyltransferase|nr:MAG: glycosyltransferase [Chloroflexi bacterium HGW-Chloroflexi-4]